MNVIIVYGCSCSGKSTYVKNNIGKDDIVYDYDKLLSALTYREDHITTKHSAHNLVTHLRWSILHYLEKDSNVKRAYIITRWPTEALKEGLKQFDVQYQYCKASKQECIERLEKDASRPDKKKWREVIRQWHEEHGEKRGVSMKEIRIAPINAEIRAEAPAGADTLVLAGRPIVYDQPTVINDPAGQYTEIIRRGALDDCDITDTRLLYNHDLSKVPLARTPKTMRLSKVPAGLEMAASLPETEEARAVYTAVERGDLSGMSFAFVVPPGGDQWDLRTRTREIFKIKKILEISVVPFPAYPQTSVEARAVISAVNRTKWEQAIIAANKLLMKEF